MKKIAIVITLLSFGIFLGAGTAPAAPTDISPGPGVPLLGPGGILDQLYGLSNLQRVDDDLDQIWFPANGNASDKAKFADFTQEFGYIPDLNGDNNFDESFVSLFNVVGTGINLGSTVSVPFSSGNVNFLWALNPSGEPQWTSRSSENSDGLDHMVTWLITGGAGNTAGNYVIAWEEVSGGGDRDFSGLVVEVGLFPLSDLDLCEDDLEQALDDLDECLADPLLADEDADGEADGTDECPATSASSEVDAAGCSQEQFCDRIGASTFQEIIQCQRSDWKNDEPGSLWPQDCRVNWMTRQCVTR